MSVRAGLLALLSDGPRHGYQLKTEFEDATGGTWSLNVGQVYSTLDRLHRDGLVDVELVVDNGSEQKRYALTATGREELSGWWQSDPGGGPPPRDALQLKVLMAVTRGTEHALDVITHQRSALTRLLQEVRRRSPAPSGNGSRRHAMASDMVTDALVTRAEAELRWLDLCERRLLVARSPR